ncbi:MAG: hypothetical protein OYH77_03935 [Pseudomonadota bacterium]|nr:hypothetical protein [Pseudomonadota bacterium]
MSQQNDIKINYDSIALEALSAGIGLGKVIPKKLSATTDTDKKLIEEPPPVGVPLHEETPAARPSPPQFQALRTVAAFGIDVLIVCASLMAAAVAASYSMLNKIPNATELIAALLQRFSPLQITIAVSSLLLAYFLLFKFLAGATLGSIVVKQK